MRCFGCQNDVSVSVLECLAKSRHLHMRKASDCAWCIRSGTYEHWSLKHAHHSDLYPRAVVVS